MGSSTMTSIYKTFWMAVFCVAGGSVSTPAQETGLGPVVRLLVKDIRAMPGKAKVAMVMQQQVGMPGGKSQPADPALRSEAKAAGVTLASSENGIRCVSSYVCEVADGDVLLKLNVVERTDTTLIVDLSTTTEIERNGKPAVSHRTYRYRLTNLGGGKWKIMFRSTTVTS
jgi:hypothetical protein